MKFTSIRLQTAAGVLALILAGSPLFASQESPGSRGSQEQSDAAARQLKGHGSSQSLGLTVLCSHPSSRIPPGVSLWEVDRFKYRRPQRSMAPGNGRGRITLCKRCIFSSTLLTVAMRRTC